MYRISAVLVIFWAGAFAGALVGADDFTTAVFATIFFAAIFFVANGISFSVLRCCWFGFRTAALLRRDLLAGRLLPCCLRIGTFLARGLLVALQLLFALDRGLDLIAELLQTLDISASIW